MGIGKFPVMVFNIVDTPGAIPAFLATSHKIVDTIPNDYHWLDSFGADLMGFRYEFWDFFDFVVVFERL